jgi:hypothetical protein
MRPLFTVHAGELVVGGYIEKNFPTLNIWVPAKDTGVDLLVTGESACNNVSLQVKLSRDYREPEATTEFQKHLTATGWMTISDEKLKKSRADYWVFVLLSQERKSKPQFLVIPPKELYKRLINIHGQLRTYHFYPWVTVSNQCFHGRGLKKDEYQRIPRGHLPHADRDLSAYLNNWAPLRAIK